MTIRALLLLGGMSLALASAASAQSVSPPAATAAPPATASVPSPPSAAVNAPAPVSPPGLPPQRIRALVRASGFDPIGPPVRRGNLYVQRALDPNAIEYRLVIDSLTGRTMSVRPMRMAGPYRGPAYGPPPYGPYGPYRPAYGRYYGPPPDDYGFYGSPRPPRTVPTARLAPTQSPQPGTSAQTPLPRPKPYVMEATGSIAVDAPQPLPSQKTVQPPPTPAPPKTVPSTAPSQDGGAAAMPPVAPLD